MPYKISGFDQKGWYKSPWLWLAVAAVIILLIFAAPHATGLYQHWRERRRVDRADTALKKRDFKHAMLNVQMVLARNPRNLEALRIGACTLEAMKSPDAIAYRRKLDSLSHGDSENSLALAESTLKFGDPRAAAGFLDSIPAGKRNSGRYHAAAARVALALADNAGAEREWEEASKIEPGNDSYQFELAKLRLNSRSSDVRASAMEMLAQLTEKPAQRLPALRALLQNAAAFHEKSRTREVADKLEAEPEATFSDHIARLAVVHSLNPEDFPAALAKLQESAVSSPENAYLLLAWMNSNNLALLIPEWEPKLAPSVLASAQVRAALAEAYARGSDWAKLRQRIEGDTWEGLEFLRFAFLARALDHLGDASGSAAAWSSAVASAQPQPRWLEMLARTVLAWGWTARADELMWKLASTRACPRWVADHLWVSSSKARDTAKMYEASRLLLKAEPKNPVARNNYIFLALLTNQVADSPHQLAEALYEQEPNEPVIATTYAFSLYQQGRPWEAVAVMNTFSSEQLRAPVVALYQGVFLAAAGENEQAAPFLKIAAFAPMLPEERALLTKATPGGAPVLLVGEIDRSRTDTLALYKDSQQKYLADPQNATARSNYILLALLAKKNLESTAQLARAQFKEHPEIPAIAINYALSLYEQDKPGDAVTAMEGLKPEQLLQPVAAAYYGVFLSAAGQAEKAAKYLEIGATAQLLPEEKALLAKTAK